MNAIEFVAQEKKGSIQIPKKYLSQLTKEFRVLILVEKKATKKKKAASKKKAISKKKKFSAVKIKTKGYTFNRDEAHER